MLNGLYTDMWSEQQTKKEDIDNTSTSGLDNNSVGHHGNKDS